MKGYTIEETTALTGFSNNDKKGGKAKIRKKSKYSKRNKTIGSISNQKGAFGKGGSKKK